MLDITDIKRLQFDVLVIGAGGAGLSAAIAASQEEGIKVEKGRWGKFYLIKSKKKILLDKNLDVASIDIDQAKEIYKANTSKK